MSNIPPGDEEDDDTEAGGFTVSSEWRTDSRVRGDKPPAEALRIRSRTLPRYLAYFRDKGRELQPLLKRFGLPDDAASRVEIETTLDALREIPTLISTELNDQALGLEVAKALPPGVLGLVELSARSAPNLREALTRLVRYSLLLNDAESFELTVHDGIAEVSHRVPGTRRALGRVGNELLMGLVVRIIRECLGKPWSPGEVCFAQSAPRDTKPLAEHFKTDKLRFEMGFNAIRFPEADLSLPLASSDPAMLHVLDTEAARHLGPVGDDGLLPRLRLKLRDALEEGRPTLQTLADALKMSSRTLQRRLEDEGTTFNALLEDTRVALAKEYLQNPRLELKEIAARTGYSDLTTFIRAFKRATHMTPRAYRLARKDPGAK